jgi:hypothetical protein
MHAVEVQVRLPFWRRLARRRVATEIYAVLHNRCPINVRIGLTVR